VKTSIRIGAFGDPYVFTGVASSVVTGRLATLCVVAPVDADCDVAVSVAAANRPKSKADLTSAPTPGLCFAEQESRFIDASVVSLQTDAL
jgi:hypothetical protein